MSTGTNCGGRTTSGCLDAAKPKEMEAIVIVIEMSDALEHTIVPVAVPVVAVT